LAERVAVVEAGDERGVAVGAHVGLHGVGQVPGRPEAEDEVDVARRQLATAQRLRRDLEVAGVAAHERAQARVGAAPGHLPPAALRLVPVDQHQRLRLATRSEAPMAPPRSPSPATCSWGGRSGTKMCFIISLWMARSVGGARATPRP